MGTKETSFECILKLVESFPSAVPINKYSRLPYRKEVKTDFSALSVMWHSR